MVSLYQSPSPQENRFKNFPLRRLYRGFRSSLFIYLLLDSRISVIGYLGTFIYNSSSMYSVRIRIKISPPTVPVDALLSMTSSDWTNKLQRNISKSCYIRCSRYIYWIWGPQPLSGIKCSKIGRIPCSARIIALPSHSIVWKPVLFVVLGLILE